MCICIKEQKSEQKCIYSFYTEDNIIATINSILKQPYIFDCFVYQQI